MYNVGLLASEKVVETHDIVPLIDKSLAQMRTQESGATGDQNSLDFSHLR